MLLIRPVQIKDLENLHRLANSQSARGFLTLPPDKEGMKELIALSEQSFGGNLPDIDRAKYLFVLTGLSEKEVIGSSLILARHGTPAFPHVFFRIDSRKRTLKLQWDPKGRTELGGLMLGAEYRGHPEKLGKRLSYARLRYIRSHPEKFQANLLVEFLPPFTKEGRSFFWESLGRRLTGLNYEEADRRSRRDPEFIRTRFPVEEIPMDSLTPEARAVMGTPGPAASPAAKILSNAGFKFLNEIDPLDGGPHYGATQEEIRWEFVGEFLSEGTDVKLVLPD